MSAARGERLQAIWYGGKAPGAGLRLLAALHGALGRAHARWWRWRGAAPLPVPVLVVGNVSVGGTGKTPLVQALVRHLAAAGWRPGIVSRGYGGSERGPALLPAAPDPARFGDEPSLMRRAGCTRVAVGRDRPAAARLLIAAGADVIIADDGLQHHALARDLEICVLDGVRRLGNGRLLPAGPLREPAARLARVDWRVCNGGTPGPGEVLMQVECAAAVNLHDGTERPLAAFAGGVVQAVAGIGNPERFFACLRGHGLALEAHPFPDHHRLHAAELPARGPVLLTDKDAVKLDGLQRADCWRVPARARLPQDFLTAVERRLRAAAASRTQTHGAG